VRTAEESASRRPWRALGVFFFAPASARPLAALRIGLSTVLLVQAGLVRAEIFDLFGRDGIVPAEISRIVGSPVAPNLGWLVDQLAPLGISEASCLRFLCGAYVAALALLAIGFHTRLAAAVSWLCNWTLQSAAPATLYGADFYAHTYLFYLMLVPAGGAFSLDAARRGAANVPTETARFGLRIMQIHLGLSYLVSGLAKLRGEQWRSGEVIWRALSLPVYRQLDASWLASFPFLCRLGCVATLAIELGYCIFIWPRRTRRLWLGAATAMHLGIAVFLGLGVFGVMMAVINVALFAVSPDLRPPLNERPGSG
jgi:Vitamin K-dependent gamma-carboxylase